MLLIWGLMSIEFINEENLYNYIRYQRRYNFKEVSFLQTIKDIKAYLFFLKYVKRKKQLPQVDLSVNNYGLWLKV